MQVHCSNLKLSMQYMIHTGGYIEAQLLLYLLWWICKGRLYISSTAPLPAVVDMKGEVI